MSNKHGDHICYELMPRDADAAESLYMAVLGWTFNSTGQSARNQ